MRIAWLVFTKEWRDALRDRRTLLVVLLSSVLMGPVLLVANHISWLDIVTMHAARYCRFVSKADIRQWPLVGSMADAAGTLYIQRESRRDATRLKTKSVDAAVACGSWLRLSWRS